MILQVLYLTIICLTFNPFVYSDPVKITQWGEISRHFQPLPAFQFSLPCILVQQLNPQKGDQFFKGVEPPATRFVGNSLNHNAPDWEIARFYFLGQPAPQQVGSIGFCWFRYHLLPVIMKPMKYTT
jgi:hypothetical protein